MMRRTHPFLSVACAAAALLAAERAAAVVHLKRGVEPPAIALPDLEGAVTRTADLHGRTVVLIFGELYHEKTLSAWADIRQVLTDDELAGRKITPLLIVGQNVPRETLAARAEEAGVTCRILQDEDRRVFGAYRVAVLPSVVVLDARGRVVHAVAGYLGRFADSVGDAVRLSEGLLSPEQFEQSLHPTGSEPSEDQSRAARLTSLGRQLARRGLPELAEEKYFEALELSPAYVPARLGLGGLYLRGGRLAEAELEFRTVLGGEPKSLDARIGLAYVQVLRGGAETGEAETMLRGVVAGNPAEARAHYLIGLIHEQRDELDEAAASFRTAAELLMSQRGTWAMPEEGAP
jgi:tetratricopeptide (TPR) repeat protein